MADQVLDAKGLNCPLPILRAKKALKDVPIGGTLQVLATDPGAVKDFEAFCRATGNDLLEIEGGRQAVRIPDQAYVLTGPERKRRLAHVCRRKTLAAPRHSRIVTAARPVGAAGQPRANTARIAPPKDPSSRNFTPR